MRWRSLLLSFTLVSTTAAFAQTANPPPKLDDLAPCRAVPLPARPEYAPLS